MFSEHYKRLDETNKSRYLKKIELIGGCDPYTWSITDLDKNFENLPKLTYMDLVNYFVFERSAHSMNEFKAYKSMDSYNLFLCGWVKELGWRKVNDVWVVLGKVLHSQRLNEKPLEVWVSINCDGEIVCAHCTCIAGLGEVCSHVGAICFTLEHNIRSLEQQSVTDVKAFRHETNIS